MMHVNRLKKHAESKSASADKYANTKINRVPLQLLELIGDEAILRQVDQDDIWIQLARFAFANGYTGSLPLAVGRMYARELHLGLCRQLESSLVAVEEGEIIHLYRTFFVAGCKFAHGKRSKNQFTIDVELESSIHMLLFDLESMDKSLYDKIYDIMGEYGNMRARYDTIHGSY